MEDIYRQHIKKNTEKLIRLTNYEKLMNGCIESELLNYAMRNNIENFEHGRLSVEELQHERHRRLFAKLTKRGPSAYQRLKNLMVALKFDEAVILLNEPCTGDTEFRSIHHRDNKGDDHELNERMKQLVANGYETGQDGLHLSKSYYNKEITTRPRLEMYSKKIQPKEMHHVQKSKFIQIDTKVGIYPMKSHTNRGVFFMVNIIDFPNNEERRNGAEEDGESLLYLFHELGFKLFPYVNLTQSEFFTLLDEIIDSDYTREAECFVMALMTHGNMDDNSAERVQFHDGSIIKVRDIEDRFENRRCPHLVHKPKIFIFPFCRGEIADYGHRVVQTDGFREANPRTTESTIPTLSDIFICYASMRGFKAHRDIIDGSWYIQKFCKLMATHAHDTDFEDIVKMIQHETGQLRTAGGAIQTGSYVNIGFNKKLYFNPGAHDDN